LLGETKRCICITSPSDRGEYDSMAKEIYNPIFTKNA